MNPRDFELFNLLSAYDANFLPGGGKPVRLANTMARDPAAPAMTDLMAVAAQTADAEIVARVTSYCDTHPEYGEMLAQFVRFAKDEEIPEPPIGGSILERMGFDDLQQAEGDQVQDLKAGPRPPMPPTDRGGWSHALAASSGSDIEEAHDWWVLRPTTDGGTLYVGNSMRVKERGTWGSVEVTLPDRKLWGVVVFSSDEISVVKIDQAF